MLNIALLITGQLRFENESLFNSFLDIIKDYDVYISTYTIYKHLAKKITDNVIFLDEHIDYKRKYQSNMYQWWHLQNLIRKYKPILLKYDILYRLRVDINIPKELFNKKTDIRTIYSFRDFIFFGNKLHFIKLFENFFDDILNKYYGLPPRRYININYSNFIKTKNPCYMWKWFTYPKFIYNNDFNIIKANMMNNMYKLNYINNNNNNKCNFVSSMPRRIYNSTKFASERIFPLHCINNGFIQDIELNFKLYKERKSFKYIGLTNAPEQENTSNQQ